MGPGREARPFAVRVQGAATLMLRFVVRRLLVSIPIVIIASFLTFLLVINAGTPAPIENVIAQPGHNPAAVEALQEHTGSTSRGTSGTGIGPAAPSTATSARTIRVNRCGRP